MELPIRFVQLNWRIILGGGHHHGERKSNVRIETENSRSRLG